MVAGGVPVRIPDHTSKVADVALDLMTMAKGLEQQNNENLKPRMGECRDSMSATVYCRNCAN